MENQQDPPSILIVAGEASADVYGAALTKSLLAAHPGTTVWGAGGAQMREAGFEAVVAAEKLAVAGLTEVLLAVPRIWLLMRTLARLAHQRRPDVVVLIDLPDFNLRLAKKLKPLGIPIVYYISPQIWAWRQGRVHRIRDLVSEMLCILPFELPFYREHGVTARFVGHPLVKHLPESPDRNTAREALGIAPAQRPVIALLPGSRAKEVNRHLPIMLAGMRLLRRRFPDAGFVVPTASTVSGQRVHQIVDRTLKGVTVLEGQATEALAAADAAVVCSGTATVQAALLSRPMVVVYKVSWLTYQILKRLVKVAHISLVNLIAGRSLVTELVQNDFTPEKVADEVRRILEDPVVRLRTNQAFVGIRQKLGSGDATSTVTRVVLEHIASSRRGPRTAHPGHPSPQTAAVDRVTHR